MVSRIIKHIAYNRYFPLNFEVEKMQPNILLMCKLLFLLLLVNGFLGYISDPFIPFIKPIDVVITYPNIFKTAIKGLFLASGLLLLFNVNPRTMAIVLGSSLIVMLLASKPMFRNHLFICGCAFLLAGLSNKKNLPWLLYMQLSLVYFGAATNKVFEPDWWSGQFMHNWLVNSQENQFYLSVSGLLPEMWFAKILSWTSMFIEFTIAILLLIRKKHLLAVWAIILFHSLLYSMTLFRFGHFFEDIVIILLIFLIWPAHKSEVCINKSAQPFFRPIVRLFFLNSKIEFGQDQSTSSNYWLKLKSGDRILFNKEALAFLLKFTPNFYVLLFFLDQLIRFLFNGTLMHSIQISLMWLCIIFFMPIEFHRKKSKKLVIDAQ
ncbi:HTTM domain-containing protein [Winogradskyella sp.]|uniref:HTTM domain-containing protein n=2 Tax=Winogradskyella sp. TaxID=1883156 RepID=UPI003512F179